MNSLESRWANIDTRMSLVPGKDVLSRFRQRIQDLHGVTLTDARIVDSMNLGDIPADMVALLTELDGFRTAAHL